MDAGRCLVLLGWRRLRCEGWVRRLALSVSGYVALGAGPVVDSKDSVCPWVLFVLVFGDDLSMVCRQVSAHSCGENSFNTSTLSRLSSNLEDIFTSSAHRVLPLHAPRRELVAPTTPILPHNRRNSHSLYHGFV